MHMDCPAAVFNPPISSEVHDHKRLSCLSQLTFKLSITSDDPHTSLGLSHLEEREREREKAEYQETFNRAY